MKLLSSVISIAAFIPALLVRAALYAPDSGVAVWDHQTFVKNTASNYCLVEFFADWCGHCQRFVPEYTRAAKALNGIVTVAAVNDERVVGGEGIQGFPTVRLYLPGGGYEVYNGPRTAEGLVEFVTTHIQTAARRRLAPATARATAGRVVTLNQANFERLVLKDREHTWFVKFYAPWCGHCKNMAPAWVQLAAEAPNGVMIGEVDATVETALASRYGVSSYPTLKVFTPSGSAVPYTGARDVASMKRFVTNYLPAPRVLHMRNQEHFKEFCETNTCIVTFLPHILDSSSTERKKYIKELGSAAKAANVENVKFFWVQGGDNPELEEKLHLQFGWPAVVSFKMSLNKYSIYRGSYTSNALKSFIEGVKAVWTPVPSNLPEWSEMPPWDGKDAPKVEEKSETGDHGKEGGKESLSSESSQSGGSHSDEL